MMGDLNSSEFYFTFFPIVTPNKVIMSQFIDQYGFLKPVSLKVLAFGYGVIFHKGI